jgi:hypothetical protein
LGSWHLFQTDSDSKKVEEKKEETPVEKKEEAPAEKKEEAATA